MREVVLSVLSVLPVVPSVLYPPKRAERVHSGCISVCTL
jgi:hypothetical protein